MKSFAVSILAGLAAQAEAFWGTAHLLIARQAQSLLEQNNPEVLTAVLNEMKPLQKYYASLMENEGNNPFTECATWADDIKGKGYDFQSPWHFINTPYFDEEGTSAKDFPKFVMPDEDVVQAMDNLTKFLKGEMSTSEASSSSYVSKIADKFSYEDDQKSMAVRLLIHYIGDIHQPLHSSALVDSTYPKGDAGGNFEHIPAMGTVSNLHAVWDSVFNTYTGFPTLPFSDDDWTWYTNEAKTLSETYPVDQSKVHAGDFTEWADEAFVMAKTLAYPKFVANTDPSQEYIDAAKPKVLEHMMYGASRLAALMVDIYGTKQEDNDTCTTPGGLCNPFMDTCCLKNCTAGGVCGHAAFVIPGTEAEFFLQ